MSQVQRIVMSVVSTLVDALRLRAETSPDRTAYVFVRDEDGSETSCTYQELDLQARKIAGWLQSQKLAGERVLLVYPQGLDYIGAFLGCLYAGSVAVPVYPPRMGRHFQRIATVIKDCCPAAALTNGAMLSRARAAGELQPELASLHWCAIEDIAPDSAMRWRSPEIDEESLAFLQYTSGSTAQPKGVMVSHGNLVTNEKMIQHAFGVTEESVIVGWLPLFHDMGLIGNVLQALWSGARCVLLSPASFLRRPVNWLNAISKYRASISGGPNFAYDWCTAKITREECSELDLSCWRIAFNGSEPVRAQTLSDFSARFSHCGFDSRAFFPCYGLAEATLFVSGGPGNGAQTVTVSSDSLARHEFRILSEGKDRTQLLVSSGHAANNETIAIIDHETLTPSLPASIGEVWVSGENVAQGYWNQPALSRDVFQAYTALNDGPYLRTGDLGYVLDGQLFITGRLKDLIIVRGRNHYPQDLEFTVARSHPAFAVGLGAAFTVEVDGNTQTVLVQEIAARGDVPALEETLRTAVQAIAEEHEIQMDVVALVPAGSLPRTSSGKVRRQECRRQFLASELKVLLRTPGHKVLPLPGNDDDGTGENRILLEQSLLAMSAKILKLRAKEINAGTPLTAYGLDSLQAAELNNTIAQVWNVELLLEELTDAPSVAAMARLLEAKLRDGPQPRRSTRTDLQEWPLSYGQRALLYLYRLAPQAGAYHIPLAISIHGALDYESLRGAIDELVRRHECLHSVFIHGETGMMQRLVTTPAPPVHFEVEKDWSDQELQAWLAAESGSTFDLEQGPLLRVTLFRRNWEQHVLLMVFHHIITDFASLTLLFHDFRELYSNLRRGQKSNLPLPAYRYADFVLWQHEMLQGKRGDELRAYWKQQLQGELPVLRLPSDRPRPAVQSHHGASFNFRIGNTLTSALLHLARAHEASTYTALLAAFTVFLHRYSSQHDIVLGSPVSGRTLSCWASITGYLINQIVHRIQLSGEEAFSKLLARIRKSVAGGLAHQDYPLALLAEDLQFDRDPAYPPIFQVMFSFQKSSPGHDENVAALALNVPGTQVDFDNTKMEAFPFHHNTSQLDLTLTVAQIGEELAASFQYNSELFDVSTISRMAEHFVMLLQDSVARAHCRIDELQLMSPEERKCLIVEWNSTAEDYSQELCIHDLFSLQALAQGDSVAVIGGNGQMTYAQLEQKSNQLARHLKAKGVGAGHIIGLCMERCPLLLAGMLGILKAGAAYLPIDPLLPDERISYMLGDARVRLVVTQSAIASRIQMGGMELVHFDADGTIARESVQAMELPHSAGHLAYVMYTSGSTGKPKGVMVTHRNVVNFFHGMEQRISCTPQDTLLAVTAISFDISVLELLWTLTRGAKVVLADPLAIPAQPVSVRRSAREMDYSLFFFASIDEQQPENKYELLMEAAKYADQNGFVAVWTPERHFHPFGGLYPNPAVTSAALAAVTRNVQVRAGSVVLPLHNVIRVAEEWSVVDNLSGGRTGLAFASGWHADDFVFAPQNYPNRKELMFQAIDTFLQLWCGEPVKVQSGSGKEIEVRIFPQPRQPRPPLWITAAGAPDTFIRAGQIGANVLTHLLGQSVEDVAGKVRLYRDALQKHGHDPNAGRVSLMLHTYLGDDLKRVKDQVRGPFSRYLMSSVDLIRNLAKTANLPLNFDDMNSQDMEDLLAFAFERYFETSAMFGTVESCQSMIEELREIGIDEIACLIDFGIEKKATMASLANITTLKLKNAAKKMLYVPRSVPELASIYKPTMMQCTPAVMAMVCADRNGLPALHSLHTLMLGGEGLPRALAHEIQEKLSCRLVNMYGPTETTIWSSTAEVPSAASIIHVGRPISNTAMYILDRNSSVPVPVGVAGELYIGGHGVARGYLNRPDITAQRFLPDPFSSVPGQRIYRTGDLARYLPDGNIELLGRNDDQVKIRGVRIELGEIETVLCEHPMVAQATVIAHDEGSSDAKRLVAYIVCAPGPPPAISDLRSFLKAKLQEAMVPSTFMFLPSLPLTNSGKVNRRLLPQPKVERERTSVDFVAPTTEYEVAISGIWKRVLEIEKIGIDDNFFDLGGHSLRLVQVHGELIRSLGRDVPLVKLLEFPTIRALAVHLATGASETKQESVGNRKVEQQAAILRQQKKMMARRSAQTR
jgi:natural product biosynthesis luciferase-like monooxygenase protein